jgi:hypothetical protein
VNVREYPARTREQDDARKLVSDLVAIFRNTPARADGSEDRYLTHQLRASLELLFEAVDVVAAEVAAHPEACARPLLELTGARRELLQLVAQQAPTGGSTR